MKKIFITLLLLSSYFVNAQFKIVGYLPNWNWNALKNAANSLDFSQLTHINVCFKNPDAAGNLIYGSDDGLPELVEAAHKNNVKVFTSLCGGANSENVSKRNIWLNLIKEENMDAFIVKIVDYAVKYKLDGVDVDLEGPAINDDYGYFIEALSISLKAKNIQMTAALSKSYGADAVKNATLDLFDWINIMAYDETFTGQHSSIEYAKSCFNYFNNLRNINAKKLVLGVPFYGYSNGTTWNYVDIMNKYGSQGAEKLDQIGTIYYNGLPTMAEKTKYAFANCSGIMIWELTNDYLGENKSKSLMGSIISTLRQVSLPDETLQYDWVSNPVSDELITSYKFDELDVFLPNGNLLQSYRKGEKINTSDWQNGIYLLKITTNNTITRTKVIKN